MNLRHVYAVRDKFQYLFSNRATKAALPNRLDSKQSNIIRATKGRKLWKDGGRLKIVISQLFAIRRIETKIKAAKKRISIDIETNLF